MYHSQKQLQTKSVLLTMCGNASQKLNLYTMLNSNKYSGVLTVLLWFGLKIIIL